jgi:hypothetical protein
MIIKFQPLHARLSAGSTNFPLAWPPRPSTFSSRITGVTLAMTISAGNLGGRDDSVVETGVVRRNLLASLAFSAIETSLFNIPQREGRSS